MGYKLSCIFFFALSSTVSAGNNALTGNFRRDLLSLKQDSVSSESTMLLQSAKRQNPFVNGLFSLAIPGAGQLKTERYTKSIVFIGIEAALISFAIISNHNGDKKTEEFERYAEAHWSAVRYAKWIGTYGVSEYGPNAAFTQADYDAVANRDYRKINSWESGELGNHTLGFSHQLPKFGEQQYYELIGKYYQFKFGWDSYPLDANGIPISDHGEYFNNFSADNQIKSYATERGKANDYYYASTFAVSALVINHVISAFDAFFSTESYNKEISAAVNFTPVNSIDGQRLFSELRLSVDF